ncbi:uncharacterized protein [Antennarius striatus]|uniref:uncharacterized protein n=1 Tax=Antennarius striatus TaxID=241820 RepID=UPI0035AEED82
MILMFRVMLKIIMTIVRGWGWTQWMFLHRMISGSFSLVVVHQPPVLTAALGHDVIMPCHFNVSYDDKISGCFLYWTCLSEDRGNTELWPPSETHKRRVDLLDKNENTSNKSILLQTVQWSDSGKYLCKLSVITTESRKRFRAKGNKTLLLVYDNMIFSLSGHNDSLLRCEVNVTRDPGFVLFIFHDGHKVQTSNSAPEATALPYITLSETMSLRGKGKYECQLHLNDNLITNSFLHHQALGGDAGRNASVASEIVFPEPWILYAGLLLVPVVFLLGLRAVLVLVKICLQQRG